MTQYFEEAPGLAWIDDAEQLLSLIDGDHDPQFARPHVGASRLQDYTAHVRDDRASYASACASRRGDP